MKKKAIPLSSVRVQAYMLLKSLLVLRKLADKTFQELVRMMANHQDPKPNSRAERFKFNNCDQKPGESITEYIAKLRRLTEHCNYSTILQNMQRDRLFCGLKHERIQQRLLTKGDTLALEKVTDIVQAMESVIKQSPLIRSTQGVEEHIENIQKVQSMGNLNCYRCRGNIYPKFSF